MKSLNAPGLVGPFTAVMLGMCMIGCDAGGASTNVGSDDIKVDHDANVSDVAGKYWGGGTPCVMPSDYLGSGELGFWVCDEAVEGGIQVAMDISVSRMDGVGSTYTLTSIESPDCSQFNWKAGVTGHYEGTSGQCDYYASVFSLHVPYYVYTEYGHRIIVQYESSSNAPDIWGVVTPGGFQHLEKNPGHEAYYLVSAVPDPEDLVSCSVVVTESYMTDLFGYAVAGDDECQAITTNSEINTYYYTILNGGYDNLPLAYEDRIWMLMTFPSGSPPRLWQWNAW